MAEQERRERSFVHEHSLSIALWIGLYINL